jgi:hypothetical protein
LELWFSVWWPAAGLTLCACATVERFNRQARRHRQALHAVLNQCMSCRICSASGDRLDVQALPVQVIRILQVTTWLACAAKCCRSTTF